MTIPSLHARNSQTRWLIFIKRTNTSFKFIKAAGATQVFVCFFLALFITACSAKKSAGVKKDFNTGLTSTYSNMEPGSALLMMNNEVLNHTDIPIGESFVLINENVTGMTVKEGKVSAGCSLRISDESGTVLLEEKDLFAGNDVFAKEDATRLKCTVNTGSPMEWEKKYKIQVVFWDKYGDGKIVNECTIRSIDIP
jgi:hypothetical protein